MLELSRKALAHLVYHHPYLCPAATVNRDPDSEFEGIL